VTTLPGPGEDEYSDPEKASAWQLPAQPGWLVDTPFDMRSKTPPSPLSQLFGEGMIESLYPASVQAKGRT